MLGGCSDCEGLGHCSEAGAAAAASVRACTLERGWGAAGSCSECELRAAEGSSDCEGTWGLQAVVVEGSSWPCRRVPASARLGGNISVATFGPCRCVVASSSRRVVAASSSPRRRRVIVVVVASLSRRVVAASLSVPPLSSPESPPSSSPSPSSPLVVVARRRRSSPRRREVSTNVSTSVSTQVSTSVSTKRYPHRPPVLEVACHPSPPLSSPHPPAPLCGSGVRRGSSAVIVGAALGAAATVRRDCRTLRAAAIVRGPGLQRL